MDTIGCQLNGKSQARGRNGWFTPAKVRVLDFNETICHGREFVVEVWSKSTTADHPPIMLRLTETDAHTMIALLQKGLDTFTQEGGA